MTKFFLFILLVLFCSCASKDLSQDNIWDEKFELCSDMQLLTNIEFNIGDGAKEKYARNIYPLLENFLLQEEILRDISKEGYKELVYKTLFNQIEPTIFEKFINEIGFDPSLALANPTSVYCYGYPYPYREDQLRKLKKGWQYEFLLVINKIYAQGGYSKGNIDVFYSAIDKIPEEKFSKEIYRRYFLDMVYMIAIK